MSGFVLLITTSSSMRYAIAPHARGVRLLTRQPRYLRQEDWDRASLVLIDAEAVPVLRSRRPPLPHRGGVTLLADPDDHGEPDLYWRALDLGAAHLITVPGGTDLLRKHILMLAASPPLIVAVLDPDPSGQVGTATAASLALAGTAAGEHLGLIDARPTHVGLHRAIQRARHDAPAAGSGSLSVLCATDNQPAPCDAVRQAMTDLAEAHAVTLAHLDPHQPDATAALSGTDLIIIPVRAGSVTAQVTQTVVATARGATPHVHVHILGRATDSDLAEAVAAGIGAGYPSMTGIALADPTGESGDMEMDAQLADTRHHRRLWDVITRHQHHTPHPATPTS